MKKQKLGEIQNQFWTHLLSPDLNQDFLSDFICDSEGFSASQRMAIYSDAYYIRIVSALAGDFKDLQRFMGESHFEKLAREYIESVPSNHFSLRNMGARLANYIE